MPLCAQVYRAWQMRFIFSLVANLTYTLFCVSIQFIILFFYRLLFFPKTYLLSSSLTVFLVYISVFFYALCIFLLVVFDANSFKSHNDIEVENERKIAKAKAKAQGADDDSDTGSDKDVPAKKTGDYVKTSVAGPEDVHLNTLFAALFCHVTIFLSVLALFAIFLYECVHDSDGLLCSISLGRHAANHAVGIAVLLIIFSVVLPLFNLYKLNRGSSLIFHIHMPTLLVLFTCLTQTAIVSKLTFYAISCPLSGAFSGSASLVYATISIHFAFRAVLVIWSYAVDTNTGAQHYPHTSNTHHDQIYSNFASLVVTTVLLLANLAYTWPISTVYNVMQSAVVFFFVCSMSMRILSTPDVMYDKKED